MSDFSWAETLEALARGDDLDTATASMAMRALMEGAASPGQIGAFLLGLRAKGETVTELVAFLETMQEFAVPVYAPDSIDTCGTGGDRSGTVNISTMAAFVVAGGGVRVAKHGNRAQSSACGSADVLEALGVALEMSRPEAVGACIDEAGIGFMFAPSFHPAMRHAGPVRRELGIRTVFNFIGPLANPARVERQTVGVSDAVMAPKLAAVLAARGTKRALLFRGDDGLDELSTTTTSRVWAVSGDVTESAFDPASLKIARATMRDLAGGDAAFNARVARAALGGERGPIRDAVELNAAAAFIVADEVASYEEGIERARQSIDSGGAMRALNKLVDVSQRFKP